MSDPADLYQSGPSSSSNFIRKWSLTLIGPGGQEYTISDSTAANAVSGGTSTIEDPLRLTFYCRHAMTASRGYAEIEIYNLALVDDVAGLNALYNSVVLRAGYLTGNFGTIFAGQIIDFTQKRAETFTETYLKIRAQSSDFAYNLATTATTFAAGQTAMKAVHQIANAMVAVGAVLGQITGLSEAPFIRGRVSYGQAVDAIQKSDGKWRCLAHKGQ